MKFEDVTIELNGIIEVVFNRSTIWQRIHVSPKSNVRRWVKYHIPVSTDSKPLGGMSEQEMHDTIEKNMKDNRKSVSVSGSTINIRRIEKAKKKKK